MSNAQAHVCSELLRRTTRWYRYQMTDGLPRALAASRTRTRMCATLHASPRENASHEMFEWVARRCAQPSARAGATGCTADTPERASDPASGRPHPAPSAARLYPRPRARERWIALPRSSRARSSRGRVALACTSSTSDSSTVSSSLLRARRWRSEVLASCNTIGHACETHSASVMFHRGVLP